MLIEIRQRSFQAWQEIHDYQSSRDFSGQYGATASFVGSMREFSQGRKVTGMTLEYYPGMIERHMGTLARDAMQKWGLLDVLVIHRVGQVKVGEDIVLVAAWSAHRKEAFESCRAIMEQLKSSAPFWKMEDTESGPHWVEKNTPGHY